MRYIRSDDSNSNYQAGHMLYVYAITKAISTTTLKFCHFEIANSKADVAKWKNTMRR